MVLPSGIHGKPIGGSGKPPLLVGKPVIRTDYQFLTMIFDRICVGQPGFGQERVGQRWVQPGEALGRIRLRVGAVIPVSRPVIRFTANPSR
jgi:hypothetical protein